MDAGRVIRPLQAKLDEVKADGLDVMLCSTEIIENVISMLKEQEEQLKEYHKADGFLACHGWWNNEPPCPVMKNMYE